MNFAIQTQSLTKQYGAHTAVRDLDLHLPAGTAP